MDETNDNLEKSFYMVLVDGSAGTSKKHSSYQSAFEEATRVGKQPNNIGKKVYILKSYGSILFEIAPPKFSLHS